jgi:hypothetical protein
MLLSDRNLLYRRSRGSFWLTNADVVVGVGVVVGGVVLVAMYSLLP